MSIDTNEILNLSGGRFQDFVAKLAPEHRELMTPHLESRMADAGKILIKQGDTPDFILIIEEGALEVLVETHGSEKSPPVSYLGRGDVIGDLGMLNQQRRTATIKTSSPVVYKEIAEEGFKQMLAEVPGFATFFAGRMARLAGSTKSGKEHNSTCTDLGGKLPNFDLLAVLYTISTGSAAGELSVLDENKNKLGSVFIGEGKVSYMRYRHLAALEGCYQMLTEQQLVGSFSFRPDAELPTDADQSCVTDITVDELLSQAMTVREEVIKFPTAVLNLQGELMVLSPEDPGAPVDVRGLNDAIIALCGKEQVPLRTLWERSGFSLYHFGKSVHYMSSIGMAKIVNSG